MIKLPQWIECDDPDFSPNDIAAVNQGGCASGAYMPAVTYYEAAKTMDKYGDDVLDYIEEACGELPKVPKGESWSGMAVFYLSAAVELWCAEHEYLEDWENEVPVTELEEVY